VPYIPLIKLKMTWISYLIVFGGIPVDLKLHLL
jgi:hypothetical protein